MTDHVPGEPGISRRSFVKMVARSGLVIFLGGLFGLSWGRSKRKEYVWQIDPFKCIQCGRCALNCILDQSAVKCVHDFAMCGYCKLCTAFFFPQPNALDEGAENQLCPTGAIRRSFVEDPYFEYEIDEPLCVGCGRCVKGCSAFGNGSLYLQVRHDRCENCNECSIAAECPSNAFVRVPVDRPYIIKHKGPRKA